MAPAVASRILKLRADLFEQAASFKGSTRKQGRAIGLAFWVFAYRLPEILLRIPLISTSSRRNDSL